MTTMNTVSGQHSIVFTLREHGQDVEREVATEMHTIAGLAAQMMRRLAAKNNSTLVQSILPTKVDDMTWDVGSHVDYARHVEDGVKPGGKGLPRFLDPEARNIVSWLQKKAFSGKGRVRKNTMAAVHRNLELRDRYEGLAWHIRHFGVKAQPFVAPTADAMEPIMLSRLDLAVRRTLGKRSAGGAPA